MNRDKQASTRDEHLRDEPAPGMLLDGTLCIVSTTDPEIGTLNPAVVRYIKLGRGGRWEEASLSRNELHFGHGKVPHEIALTADKDLIKQHRIGTGRDPQSAADDAREIIDFYTLGTD
jgi:hypothetical protein